MTERSGHPYWRSEKQVCSADQMCWPSEGEATRIWRAQGRFCHPTEGFRQRLKLFFLLLAKTPLVPLVATASDAVTLSPVLVEMVLSIHLLCAILLENGVGTRGRRPLDLRMRQVETTGPSRVLLRVADCLLRQMRDCPGDCSKPEARLRLMSPRYFLSEVWLDVTSSEDG